MHARDANRKEHIDAEGRRHSRKETTAVGFVTQTEVEVTSGSDSDLNTRNFVKAQMFGVLRCAHCQIGKYMVRAMPYKLCG